MKCPRCGAWSLVPDPRRNGFVCEVYGGFIPAEYVPDQPHERVARVRQVSYT
ncbi:hypothetical protein SEA_CAMBIARE_56 [Mycobacterium phage Cambiare]|uniref:Helix-turn-helix DNA binding domain protein n=2 Tax=Avocadovirus TaxID=2946813 RepID=A0A222YY83_9CAUD|nr:HTH DNA binding protein [Mycobacterium phage Cambiare]YP_010051529.1 HTH DNA binding protein [Mycobacterium phage Avocado]AKF14558.1 hypothetical protein SEA_CAMBIARE_56 [Mycobacterium phage Cambiare]ASR77258.1 helix-turn-helix DNA-binding domain protein [Mycobacterium phage Avocado]